MSDVVEWLKQRPLLAKSLTTGVISACGPLISHRLSNSKGPWPTRKVIAFFLFGLGITGPVTQTFYKLLEHSVPDNGDGTTWIRKLLIDRLLFAPPFLLLFLFGVNVLEGKSPREAWRIILQNYWPALKANWKVWTFTQYINLNYVPLKFRAVFASVVALGWNAYIAMLSR